MTGLDPEVHHIMEAACIITDSELNIIEDGLNLIIHQPDEVLNQMNDWCKEQHGLVWQILFQINTDQDLAI